MELENKKMQKKETYPLYFYRMNNDSLQTGKMT